MCGAVVRSASPLRLKVGCVVFFGLGEFFFL